jgi:hypothetical protein
MIAALICVLSLTVLLQFLVSYCRSVLAASGRIELSERVRELTGMGRRSVAASDFERFLQLVHLCPDYNADQTELRAVRVYYGLLLFLGRISGVLSPRVARWAERERQSCSYFAAVALDRRISYNRGLFAQQANGLF